MDRRTGNQKGVVTQPRRAKRMKQKDLDDQSPAGSVFRYCFSNDGNYLPTNL